MPIGEMHSRQKSKNIALLVILALVVVALFLTTMVRFEQNTKSLANEQSE